MKPGESTPNRKLGLALSGGGYRAAAFHLGTLRALNRLGILKNVDVLSTVSGGSIVGAAYALALTQPYDQFETIFVGKLKKSVIRRLLFSWVFIRAIIGITGILTFAIWFQFTGYPWITWIVAIALFDVLLSIQFKVLPVSNVIEEIYDSIFFDGKGLLDLPARPTMAINSTNLETGRQFTFSRDWMSDATYRYSKSDEPILFTTDNFPLSRAVMASSCVPFAFTPVRIDKEFFMNPALADDISPELIDGGVFDNQGIHKLTAQKSHTACEVVIVSDAGNKMGTVGSYKNSLGLLVRTMDLFMNRIKKFQIMDNIYQPGRDRKRQIAYISLGWDLDRCIPGFVDNLREGNIPQSVIDSHGIPKQYLEPLNEVAVKDFLEEKLQYLALKQRQQSESDLQCARDVATNLTALSDREINALINQAELMTELQVQLYCPSLFVQNSSGRQSSSQANE
ncbi:MAG: patatin-like phospholipase family protein [Cyclobacteriaceae bacterium]|jgi:NTE family protein